MYLLYTCASFFSDNPGQRRGQHTQAENHIKRCSFLIGSVAQDVMKPFDISWEHMINPEAFTYSSDDDVAKFISEYHKDKLFDVIPGRNHPSFPQFWNVVHVEKPSQLAKHLLQCSNNLDKERCLLQGEGDHGLTS